MRKRNIVVLASITLTSIALASCTNSKDATDTSALTYEVTKKWFMDGHDFSKEKVSDVYTTKIYDPSTEENFDKNKPYYTIYAASDISSTVRMVETEITKDLLSKGTNEVLYLQTSAFADADKNSIVSNVSNNESIIKSSITDFEANVQKEWGTSLNNYNITSTVDNKSNYLEVLYVPLFIRRYSSYKEDNTSLTVSTFVCVPVKVFATTFEDSKYSNELANKYTNKKATYDFDNKNLIIS